MLTRHVLILIYINRLHPRCIDGLSNRSDPCGNSMAAHTVFSGVIVDPSESLCQLRAAAVLDGDTANDEASRLRWRLRRLNGPPATNIYNLTRRSGRHKHTIDIARQLHEKMACRGSPRSSGRQS